MGGFCLGQYSSTNVLGGSLRGSSAGETLQKLGKSSTKVQWVDLKCSMKVDFDRWSWSVFAFNSLVELTIDRLSGTSALVFSEVKEQLCSSASLAARELCKLEVDRVAWLNCRACSLYRREILVVPRFYHPS